MTLYKVKEMDAKYRREQAIAHKKELGQNFIKVKKEVLKFGPAVREKMKQRFTPERFGRGTSEIGESRMLIPIEEAPRLNQEDARKCADLLKSCTFDAMGMLVPEVKREDMKERLGKNEFIPGYIERNLMGVASGIYSVFGEHAMFAYQYYREYRGVMGSNTAITEGITQGTA
jgi:hypothetical protein